MADLIPQSEYRKELNKTLLENERIQKENLERERMAENQNAILAARGRALAARKREQEMRDGFSMAPFSNEIQLKDVSNSAHRNGFYADFNSLATQFIKQNKDNKYALDSFKKKNPLEQRKFLKEHCREFRTIHYRVQIRFQKALFNKSVDAAENHYIS